MRADLDLVQEGLFDAKDDAFFVASMNAASDVRGIDALHQADGVAWGFAFAEIGIEFRSIHRSNKKRQSYVAAIGESDQARRDAARPICDSRPVSGHH